MHSQKIVRACHCCYRPLGVHDERYCVACLKSGAADTHAKMMKEMHNAEPRVPRKRNLPLPPPTDRQLKILSLLSEGKNQAEAGRAIGITQSTVYKHLIYVKRKLKAKNTAEAIAIAIRDGLIS